MRKKISLFGLTLMFVLLIIVFSPTVSYAETETTTYSNSETATSGAVTLKVEWNNPRLGEPTTFHVSATGGSGNYKFRMDAPSYSNPGENSYESVADPSRGEWMNYTNECSSYDYSFTMMASGTYNFRFYLMDKTAQVYYLRFSRNISVSDEKYPSIKGIVSSAVSQCNRETNGSDYEKALWLHNWLLQQLDYDGSLNWCSAESALTRKLGTCQGYTNAYMQLLTAAGIENSETRDTYDGHTWNAMKLDGEWYQVDCTWDDATGKWYGFDQTKLYFGLSDELMAIAHPGYVNIYKVEGYATRSTSLANNYFVKSGDAQKWADNYVDRIQEKLDAGETEFSISADNAKFPPSISGIQNGIIAYVLNQMSWSSNGEKIILQANGEAEQFVFNVSKNESTLGDSFYSYTLKLNGTIAINLYMNLTEELAQNSNAYMEFTFPDSKITRVFVKDAEQKNGYYIFSCRVTAMQMTDVIKAQMVANNQKGKEYNVSVQKYSDYILKHPDEYSDTVVGLVKSMLNYGAAAQTLLGYQTSTLANSVLEESDRVVSDADFSKYKHSIVKKDNIDIKWYGSSLLLDSDTYIRDYFILSDEAKIEDYSFYHNSQELIPQKKIMSGTTYYYVDISNIKAQDLDKDVEVIVQKRENPDENIIELHYNAFSYAYAMHTSSNPDENTEAVTKAMYQYWTMAKKYEANE